MSMMDSLKKFDKGSFVKMAKFSVPDSTKKIVEKDIASLKKISEFLWDATEVAPSKDLIENIRQKLSKKEKFFTSKECRIMSLYPHDIAQDDKRYYTVIADVLEKNWNDTFLRRLLCFIVNDWNNVVQRNNSSYGLYNLFLKKLKTYNGKAERLKHWKKLHSCFLDQGPEQVGEYLRNGNFQSPLTAIEHLKLPESYFSAHYFDNVIRAFYYGVDEIPKDLDIILQRHGDLETTKIVLSDLIIKTKQSVQLLNQKKSLQHMAITLIGHPSIPGLWVSNGENKVICKKIQEAGKIVNQWLVEVYVEEIFANFIQDPKRMNYWMKYAKAGFIEDVKVVGCNEIARRLSSYSSLKDTLDYCFIQTRKSERQCAFIMKIKGYNIIEFSEMGAIYIYQYDTKIENLKKYNKYSELKDLKTTTMPFGLKANGDCRYAHRSTWEWDLDSWFRRYRGVNV